jgi:hypothetical protein
MRPTIAPAAMPPADSSAALSMIAIAALSASKVVAYRVRSGVPIN